MNGLQMAFPLQPTCPGKVLFGLAQDITYGQEQFLLIKFLVVHITLIDL